MKENKYTGAMPFLDEMAKQKIIDTNNQQANKLVDDLFGKCKANKAFANIVINAMIGKKCPECGEPMIAVSGKWMCDCIFK